MIASTQRRFARLFVLFSLMATAASLVSVTESAAQLVQPDALVIPRGTSQIVSLPNRIERVSIGDPEVADAVVVSPQEILVNARLLGTTTLIVWDVIGVRRTYGIEVTVDAPGLQRQLQALYPGQNILVTASGTLVIISGNVTDRVIAQRALQIAAGTGAMVIDNLQIPPPQQILLNVRFAEVSQRALERLGADFLAGRTSALLNPLVPNPGDIVAGSTLSEGLVDLFLFEDDVQVSAVIDALQRNGTFRSLAEPNLLAIEGQEGTFLAGGEFPYPVPQIGADGGAGTITIEFKEFGVRLRYLPTITATGTIRMEIAPEVSSLDFASGVQLSGFNVPALLTRRAQTSIELRDGQTFAIAGLLDNNAQNTIDKVPFLGDIPILGVFFRRRETQQNRTELLVLVTPRIVQPMNTSPPVPTGEPDAWGLLPPAQP